MKMTEDNIVKNRIELKLQLSISSSGFLLG